MASRRISKSSNCKILMSISSVKHIRLALILYKKMKLFCILTLVRIITANWAKKFKAIILEVHKNKFLCLQALLTLKTVRNLHHFVLLSSYLDHSPAVIWIFLHSVLKMIQENETNAIHFSPMGVFINIVKRETFIYLICLYLNLILNGSLEIFFLKSGYDKESADGVGGTLKRMADCIVV